MKILAFQGSPRIEGNTDILLEETLNSIGKSGHEIQLFRLNLMDIKPCQNCSGCNKTGRCIINDAM
ncbi:NAD(P)H-dependent oxidoreductase, partial [Thermodesulfovibrionales bacterium]|nr:NAD(P)H-dependent oxidoreductase [Thermodesulfovibrionales bacterium]